MIQEHPICSDDLLREILRAESDVDCDSELLEHVETCSHCQRRLDELAADGFEWEKAIDVISSNDRVETGEQPATRAEFQTIAWTESMAKGLLAPPTHPEMLGRIGRYDIERLIGSGGMGVVFKAHDTELNRPVAIKLLAPYLAGSGTAKNRFAREARAAAGVVDDHVVPIFNVESDAEPPFLVMQYVAGGSLQEKLTQRGPLDVAEILRIGLQVAKGLSAAHAQGLIHRDVKPSNILLDEGVERAMLTDFGLARAESDACLTRSGFHPGTPHYMSPEQVRGESIDARSDLFGLGCVLYATCVGHPPFRAESSYAVLRRVTDDSPRPVREINSHIPAWLEGVVLKLLSKRRDDRFESAAQVAQLLADCLAHVQEPTTVPLPESLDELVARVDDESELDSRTELRQGFRSFAAGNVLAVAALAIPLIFAGIFVTLETRKGTIRIESDADNVPVVIKKSGQDYDKLIVDRDGKSIRVHAGEYEVLFDGDVDRFAVENGSIELRRGKEVIVRIRQEAVAQNELGAGQNRMRDAVVPLPEPTQVARDVLNQHRTNRIGPALNRDVFVSLKSELAQRYLRMLNGQLDDVAQLPDTVELLAKVTEALPDNRYRVQHFSRQNIKGKPDHSVALEAIVGFEDFELVESASTRRPSGATSRSHASESDLAQKRGIHITLFGREDYAIRAAYQGVRQTVSAHFQLGETTAGTQRSLLQQSQIIHGAESIWRNLLTQWNAADEDVAGQRVQLKVEIDAERPSGFSSWSRDLSNPQIVAAGSMDDLLADILPRQITHIILSRLSGRTLPRWIEMGTGTLAQSAETREKNWARLQDLHQADLLLPLRSLCSLKEYPSNTEQLKRAYIQSMAFCEFLIATQGREFLRGLATRSHDFELPDAMDPQFREWLTMRFAISEAWKPTVKETAQAGESVQADVSFRAGTYIDIHTTAKVDTQDAEVAATGNVIATESDERLVQLSISGDDVPFVQPGDPVRLHFEGWPAVESVGAFGGEVTTVEPVADEAGDFRVVVKADGGVAWPEKRYLRPGVRVKAWVTTVRSRRNERTKVSRAPASTQETAPPIESQSIRLLPGKSPSDLVIDAPEDFIGGMVDIRATTNDGLIGQVIESKLLPTDGGRARASIDLSELDDGYYSALVDTAVGSAKADGTYQIHWFHIERAPSPSDSLERQEVARTSLNASPSPIWRAIEEPGKGLVGFWEVQRKLSAKPSEDGRVRHVIENGIAEFRKSGNQFLAKVSFQGDDSHAWYPYLLFPRRGWYTFTIVGGELTLSSSTASCTFSDEEESVVLNFKDSALDHPPNTRHITEVDLWQLKRLTQQAYMRRRKTLFPDAASTPRKEATNRSRDDSKTPQPVER